METQSSDSWLQSLSQDNLQARNRQLRSLQAERFLHEILYPFTERAAELNEESLTKLIVDFQRSRSGDGIGFEMSNVFGGILQHLSCYPDSSTEAPHSEIPMLGRDVALTTILCDLDLDAVDREVIRIMNGKK